jgi:hypothetical protein
MSAYPGIGRWKFYSSSDDGWTHYQGRDTPPEGQWVVPCDEAAIERGARAVSGGLTPTGKERRLAEAVLRAAGEAP